MCFKYTRGTEDASNFYCLFKYACKYKVSRLVVDLFELQHRNKGEKRANTKKGYNLTE